LFLIWREIEAGPEGRPSEHDLAATPVAE